MKLLELAPGLQLPADEAVAQKYAFIGRSGSGKSYAASKLAELLLDAGAQVVVVDPVGIWYGLRLAADGKSPGVPVPIFGGQHGDIPLEATAGVVVADLVASRPVSLVLDVSEFSGGEQRRFVADFAEQLLHGKKRHRAPVLVIWEESQEFVPERAFRDAARMVGAMQRLVKIGRNFGVGTVLVTQRPQAVSKEVLNQTETLFVFQTTGPHERKAIEGWVVEHGLDLKGVVAQLPSLAQGTGYVWSPQWLRKFQQVRVHPKRTFDASATPVLSGKTRQAAELAPVDLAQMQEAMSATVQRAKDNDPRELRRRLAELERQLRERLPTETKVERVEVPVLKNGQLEQLTAAVGALAEQGQSLAVIAQDLRSALTTATRTPPVVLPVPPALRPRPPAKTVASPSGKNGDAGVGSGGLRRILVALAQRPGLSNRQIGLRAGLSSQSGTFATYLGKAKAQGWVRVEGERRFLTEEGLAALGTYEPLPEGQALLGYWLNELGGGAARMLRALADAYPHGLTHEQIGQRATISPASGTFATYLGRLRGLELVEGRGTVRASAEFFD